LGAGGQSLSCSHFLFESLPAGLPRNQYPQTQRIRRPPGREDWVELTGNLRGPLARVIGIGDDSAPPGWGGISGGKRSGSFGTVIKVWMGRLQNRVPGKGTRFFSGQPACGIRKSAAAGPAEDQGSERGSHFRSKRAAGVVISKNNVLKRSGNILAWRS
jgi:hypothetical protein